MTSYTDGAGRHSAADRAAQSSAFGEEVPR
jgi:hypothetical protein